MKNYTAVIFGIVFFAGCATPSPIPSGDTEISIYSESYTDSPRSVVKIFFDPTWSTDEKAEQAAQRVWDETMGGQKFDTCKLDFEGSGAYRFQYTYRRSGEPDKTLQYDLHLSLPERKAVYNTGW